MFFRKRPSTYDEQLRDECCHWEERQTDARLHDVIRQEQQASNALGYNTGHLSLNRFKEENQLAFERGLSLGCGEGRAERHLIQTGVCARFEGVDIAEESLARAEQIARDDGLDITYERQDLNRCRLQAGRYDLVVAQNVLHHVTELEHLAGEIRRSLLPDGILWIYDYIGEARMQYSDDRIRIANDILQMLPEDLRRNRLRKSQKPLKAIRRPKLEKLSPFEAIRSDEIVPVFSEHFEIIAKHEFNAILQLLFRMGLRQNYLQTENGKTIFDLIRYTDDLLISRAVLEPLTGQYIMRPKAD